MYIKNNNYIKIRCFNYFHHPLYYLKYLFAEKFIILSLFNSPLFVAVFSIIITDIPPIMGSKGINKLMRVL